MATGKFLAFLLLSLTVFCVITTSGDLEMLKMACTRILNDKGFQIPTEKAGLALITAERLMKWTDENKDEAEQFAFSLG